MPSSEGQRGRPFRDHREVVEGIIYRLRTGIAWRDLPASFGPWQTVWKRHKRFSTDGTWDRIHARLVAEADAKQAETRQADAEQADTKQADIEQAANSEPATAPQEPAARQENGNGAGAH